MYYNFIFFYCFFGGLWGKFGMANLVLALLLKKWPNQLNKHRQWLFGEKKRKEKLQLTEEFHTFLKLH